MIDKNRARGSRRWLGTLLAATTLGGSMAAVALGAGTASAARRPDAHARATLVWWTWTANPQNVIANFEKKYPWITVKQPPNYGSGSTFYAKLTTALAAGTGPDVTQVEYDHLPQYVGANDLLNIAKYVSSYKKDFPSWVWGQVSKGSAVYAMPEDIGPMGLIYQPAVLKKYHLPVPATWAQFASDAVTLHKDDPSMYLTYFPVNDADIPDGMFWQAGARPYHELSNGTWQVNVDGPVEQKIIKYWATLVKEGAVAVDQDFTADWGHHIAEDRYAAFISAAWSPTYMIDEYLPKNTTQRYAVAQLPQWSAGAHVGANWGGSTNAVTKDCPPNLVADAALFAAYINTSKSGLTIDEKPATAAGGGRGLFPADLARASVAQFNAPVPNFIGNVNAEFSKLAAEVPETWQWSPWETEFDTYLPTNLEAAVAGKLAWSQVLPKTQSELVAYAKSAGYTVES